MIAATVEIREDPRSMIAPSNLASRMTLSPWYLAFDCMVALDS